MLDKEHPNHKHTEEILDVFGSDKAVKNIIRNCHERKLENLIKGKGGRPPSEAMEFVFTLPKGIRPEKDQWKEMIRGVMTDVAKKMGLSGSEFDGIVRGVVHRQSQDESIKGSGDHMHLMIGKFTNDNKHLPELQRKGVLYVMKESFNKQMREVMGVDHRLYEPKKGYGGLAKKRVPKWKVDAARANEALVAREQKLNDALGELDAQKAQYADSLVKLTAYAEKYSDALDRGDVRQANRQKNRYSKEIEKALPLQMALDDQDAFESTPELVAGQEALNRSVDAVNKKSTTQLQSLGSKPTI